MRILMLAQVVAYPPDAGPKAKSLIVVRHLARQHEVTLCAFARSDSEVRNAAVLRQICHRVVTVPLHRSRLHDARFLLHSVAAHDSFLLRRDDRAAMHLMVRRLLREEQFDMIHVDQLNMMRFVPPDWHGTVVLDDHNAVWRVVERLRDSAHDPFRHWLFTREARIVGQAEGAACRRSHLVLAVSEQDRAALQIVAGIGAPIEVVPIGVDLDRFLPVKRARRPRPDRLLNVGTIFWPPNSDGVAWWLREGYDNLLTMCPDVTYDVVGARPSRHVRRLSRRYRGVRLHGYVADPTPFWISAGVLAVPLLAGSGVRVKILEAMAMGVTVVSTPLGAEGLAVRSGDHLLLADTPAAFALACAAILRDPALAQGLVERAYRLVRERYAAPVTQQALDAAYSRIRARTAEGEDVPCASRS